MNTWEIESITAVPKFLAAVARHFPAACTVSFEVHNACAEARQLYAKHQSPVKIRPFRDTLFPKTELFYCTLSQALADALEAVLRDREIKEVLWHVKGFCDLKLLFAIHDADTGGTACLSSQIGREAVSAIAAFVGRTAIETQTYYDWDKEHRPKGS